MTTVQEVLEAANALSDEGRAQLLDALWQSVSPDDWPLPSAEWVAEAQRRSAEIDAGQMTTSSWQDVRQRARRKAGLDG
jgi:putative addiction module component (TIGR02574 family)